MQNQIQKNKKMLVMAMLASFSVCAGPGLLWAEKPAAPAATVLSAPDAVEQATLAGTEGAGVEAVEGNISLDFKEADINTVLRVLSLKSKVNIVTGPEVQGTVTIRLDDVPWEKALEVVLRTYNYVFERDGNIIRVTTREKMAQEPVLTQTYILNYTRAVEIQDSVKDMLSERGRVRVAERTNTIVVTDIPTNLYKIHEVIKKLDRRTPQAYIDSKIIKTDMSTAENMGIAWTPTASLTGSSRPSTFPFAKMNQEDAPQFLRQFMTPSADVEDVRSFPAPTTTTATATYTYGTLNFSTFQATLNFLKSRSNTKIVSNPRIVVLNNQAAKVQVGEQIPLPKYERNETTGSVEITGFKYRDVGVILNVTPHINSQEEILVELFPEVSTKSTEEQDFGDFQMPIFTVTQAQTQVLIRSGETIAIGGLLTDNSQLGESKLPYLSDLPVVGKIFRSKRQESDENSKAETLFFITVTMVDTEGQPVGERLASRKKAKMSQGAQAEEAAKKQAAAEADAKTANVQASETLIPENTSAKSEESESKAA